MTLKKYKVLKKSPKPIMNAGRMVMLEQDKVVYLKDEKQVKVLIAQGYIKELKFEEPKFEKPKAEEKKEEVKEKSEEEQKPQYNKKKGKKKNKKFSYDSDHQEDKMEQE